MTPTIPTSIDGSPGGRILRRVGWVLLIAAAGCLLLGIYFASETIGTDAARGALFVRFAQWAVPSGLGSALCFAAGYAADDMHAAARHAIIHSQLLQRAAEMRAETKC